MANIDNALKRLDDSNLVRITIKDGSKFGYNTPYYWAKHNGKWYPSTVDESTGEINIAERSINEHILAQQMILSKNEGNAVDTLNIPLKLQGCNYHIFSAKKRTSRKSCKTKYVCPEKMF